VGRKKIAYHFHVISDKVVNAFAIPGGGVYVYTGLLAKIENEAQLAGVLAHEIKHIDLKHCIALYAVLSRLPEAAQNQAAVVAAGMIRHPFDSRRESEADRRGLELSFTRVYSPFQVVRFWEGMASRKGEKAAQQGNGPLGEILGRVLDEANNVLSTHPDSAKRACLLRNHIRLLLAKYPHDRFYVGRWNYERQTPAARQRV
jgi:predicted Zn-dependent protease